jgi:hypothetical protein
LLSLYGVEAARIVTVVPCAANEPSTLSGRAASLARSVRVEETHIGV